MCENLVFRNTKLLGKGVQNVYYSICVYYGGDPAECYRKYGKEQTYEEAGK